MNQEKNKCLAETRSQLISEIALLNADEFNRKIAGEGWSIGQVCDHLVISEKVFTKAIAYGLEKESRKQPDRVKVELILDRSKKFPAPDSVVPGEGPFDMPNIIGQLNESRNGLLELLSTVMDKTVFAQKTVKHPLFGSMPLDQWVESVYLHEQRHIEQIREIKQQFAFS